MSKEEKPQVKKGNYQLGLGLLLILVFILAIVFGNGIQLFGNGNTSRWNVPPILCGLLGVVLVFYSLRGLLKTRKKQK